jgi:D-alanyl-D-alanine carboxypeptidase
MSRDRFTLSLKLRKIWVGLGIPADYAAARHLPLQKEPRNLVRIGHNPEGRSLRLTPRAGAAWRRMQAAAAADGITLVPISAFRSIARQTNIIRQKLTAGQPVRAILRLVAAPGCSEHHTGRALDLASVADPELEERFALTPEFRWLKKHAGRFGFHLSYPPRNPHGIAYEPWHWCWRS